MSYVTLGAADPFALFDQKLKELREGKAEEDAGRRPPTPLSTIPGECWDQSGFKECHAIAFRAAQADCEAKGKRDDGSCIVPLADHYAANGCPCEKEPGLFAGMTGNTWMFVGLAAVGAWAMFGGKKKES